MPVNRFIHLRNWLNTGIGVICLLLVVMLAVFGCCGKSGKKPTPMATPILTSTPIAVASPPIARQTPSPTPIGTPTATPTPTPTSTPDWQKVYNKDILEALRPIVEKVRYISSGDTDFLYPDNKDLAAIELLNTEFNIEEIKAEIKALFGFEKIVLGAEFLDDVYLPSYISKKEISLPNIWEARRITIEQIDRIINEIELKLQNVMKLYDLPITKLAVEWGLVTHKEKFTSEKHMEVLNQFKKEVLEPLRDPIRFKDEERFRKLAAAYLISYEKYSSGKNKYDEFYKSFPWKPLNEVKVFDIIKEYPIILSGNHAMPVKIVRALSPMFCGSSNTWVNLMTIQYKEPFIRNKYTRVGAHAGGCWVGAGGAEERFSLYVSEDTDKLLQFFEMEKDKEVFAYLRTFYESIKYAPSGRDNNIRTRLLMIYKSHSDLMNSLEFYSKEQNYDSTGILFAKDKVGFRSKAGKVFYTNYFTTDRILSIITPMTINEVSFEGLSPNILPTGTPTPKPTPVTAPAPPPRAP